jgi:oxygen-dependent protoporphyrinogen oxidase
MSERVIVVGAGVSGLAAAYRLKERGYDVTVLESTDHVGGKTAATRRDGFILNTGATVLGGSYAAMRRLAADVGVADQILKVKPTIGLMRDREVHWLRGAPPGALVDFLRTKVISGRSKLLLRRLAADALKARKKAGYDQPQLRAQLDIESIDQYCDRRLNAELKDRFLAPLVGGLFGWSGGTSSIADLYFTLVKVLGGGMLGYTGGMDFFARAVAAELHVVTRAEVTRIVRDDTGVEVTWTTDGASTTERVAGVVTAVAAPVVGAIYPGLDPRIQGILNEGMPQASFLSVRFALTQVPDREALLVIVPEGELDGIATIMYEHHISPGAAPAGKGLVGVLLYDQWVKAHMDDSDDQIIEAVLPALDHVVPGIADMVQFAEVTRWPIGAVHTVPGVHQRMGEIDRLCDPTHRVQLAGDFLSLPSINGSVVTGETAATRLAAAIG